MQDDERQPLVANEERTQSDDVQTPLLEATVPEANPSDHDQECEHSENPTENPSATATVIEVRNETSYPQPPPAFLADYPETTELPPDYDSAYNRDWVKNYQPTSDPQSQFDCQQPQRYPNDPRHSFIPRIPSYNEAERNKQNPAPPNRCRREEELSDDEIGTGFAFMGSMFVSFIFCWIGFIICYCASSTIAGRYGAFAGFGLSLIKWGLILQHVNFEGKVATGDNWLWWIVVAFGWFIFMRAIVVYYRIKNIARNRQLAMP